MSYIPDRKIMELTKQINDARELFEQAVAERDKLRADLAAARATIETMQGGSWNKGIKGIDVGGRETRFQPGCTPPNVQDVGALRVTSDGVLQIKLAPGPQQWVMLSHYTWWLHTGKWPRRGYLLRARNGDPHDTRFENLEHISKRENMRRNTIHNYPPELARLVQLRGALTRQINRREKAA